MELTQVISNPLILQGVAITTIMVVEDFIKPSRHSVKGDRLADKVAMISVTVFILAATVAATYISTTHSIEVADWALVAALGCIGFFSSRARGWIATAGLAIVGCVFLSVLVNQPLTSLTEVPFQILNYLGIML